MFCHINKEIVVIWIAAFVSLVETVIIEHVKKFERLPFFFDVGVVFVFEPIYQVHLSPMEFQVNFGFFSFVKLWVNNKQKTVNSFQNLPFLNINIIPNLTFNLLKCILHLFQNLHIFKYFFYFLIFTDFVVKQVVSTFHPFNLPSQFRKIVIKG